MSDVQEIIFRTPVQSQMTSGAVSETFTSDTSTGPSIGVNVPLRIVQKSGGEREMVRMVAAPVTVTISTAEPMIPGTTIPLYRNLCVV